MERSILKFCTLIILLFPSAAFAEVCDKEVPSWDVANGPVSQLEYAVGAATGLYGLMIVGLLVLGLVFKRLWLHLIGGVLGLLLLLGLTSMLSDPIYAASIKEGCRASPYLVMAALAGLVLTFGLLAARSWKMRTAS